MLSLFKRTPIYIRIFYNKIEITNLNTAETVSGNAIMPFSTSRIVVASFQNTEDLILSLLKELKIKTSFFPTPLKILIQQMENPEDGLSEIEKRALRDLGEQIGGVFVKLIEHTKRLNNDEALLELG